MTIKRAANRKRKKDIILEKAIEVFAKNGSQQATIADVAKAAKTAQGTIYLYFSSKEELLNECLQKIINPEIQAIIDATQGITDTMDRLYEFFVQHIKLVQQKPYIARFLTMEARQNEEFYRAWPDYNPLKKYLNWVQKTAEEAIADKRIRPLDTKAFAFLIVGVMDLTMAQWLANPENLDIFDMAESIRDIIRHGTIH
jgi:TetR/AcrR family transcriptional regulator, fatty acid metabolism regulator protein